MNRISLTLTALGLSLAIGCSPLETERCDTTTPEETDTDTAAPEDTDTDTAAPEDTDTDTAEPEETYEDLDGDGYTSDVDCNDSPLDANQDGLVDGYFINPGATEICDGIDNDCNDIVDDGLELITVYQDYDGDGYGAGQPIEMCGAFDGYALTDGDCNDEDASIHPGADDPTGDGIDQNCDDGLDNGETDQGTDGVDDGTDTETEDDSTDDSTDGTTEDDGTDETEDDTEADEELPVDADGDGYVEGYDCDDSDPTVGMSQFWYFDADGDGYGDIDDVVDSCEQLSGYVSDGTDCDDDDADINPDAAESFNDLDDNCDGSVDEDWQVVVEVSYPDAYDYDLNTALYFDGASPNTNSWVHENVSSDVIDGYSEAMAEYTTADYGDVSDTCGLIVNGDGADQDYLCYVGTADNNVTFDVWVGGTWHTDVTAKVWIANADSLECAVILQTNTDSACDPIDAE